MAWTCAGGTGQSQVAQRYFGNLLCRTSRPQETWLRSCSWGFWVSTCLLRRLLLPGNSYMKQQGRALLSPFQRRTPHFSSWLPAGSLTLLCPVWNCLVLDSLLVAWLLQHLGPNLELSTPLAPSLMKLFRSKCKPRCLKVCNTLCNQRTAKLLLFWNAYGHSSADRLVNKKKY